MENVIIVLSIFGFITFIIGLANLDGALSGAGIIMALCALFLGLQNQHSNNCTCKECTPIAVKEYCPCGCGQYEIVYR